MANCLEYELGKKLQIPFLDKNGAEVLVNGVITDTRASNPPFYCIKLDGPYKANVWLSGDEISKLYQEQPQQQK